MPKLAANLTIALRRGAVSGPVRTGSPPDSKGSSTYWAVSDDKSEGSSFLVFDSKQSAENAVTMARNSPMPPGVAFVSIEIREVTADA
jgi:hypothetical protein